MKIMAECGIYVVKSPADIGNKMAEVMNQTKTPAKEKLQSS